MCGITGYLNLKSPISKKFIDNMLTEIKHRGPDDRGIFFDKNIALGMQRLSIIDLKGGHQPLCNEDKSIWIVFNGEIYNHKNLREQLIKKGHRFSTKSDTETIVHLYEECGEDFAHLLNGMFAFAIWDKNHQKLILVRDFAGIKPLYFYQSGSQLIFGSELKAILKYPNFKRKINPEALNLYKLLGYIPGPLSIFKDIYKLMPGTMFIFSPSGKRIKSFFKFDNLKEKNDNLDKLLEESVAMQSQADVPVGVFLSGGIDSSLVTYYLTKINRKPKTFSISFQENSFDESKYFNEVSTILGTDHYTDTFGVKDALDLFPKIAVKLDEPLADPSLLPTYKVSKLTRKYVKVVLSGDGGDELFAGYPTYPAHILANILQIIPKEAIDSLIKLIEKMPISYDNFPLSEKMLIFLSGIKHKTLDRHILWMSLDKKSFEKNRWYNLLFSYISKLPFNWQAQVRILDLLTYLTDDLLVKVDRASMYNSLEVRVPFLDPAITNFALTTSQKHFDLFETKKLLRNLLYKKFPNQITKRGKKGFGIPLGAWIYGPMKDMVYDYLNNKSLYDFFDKKMITESLRRHSNKEANLSRKLWMLTVFSGWLQEWKNFK